MAPIHRSLLFALCAAPVALSAQGTCQSTFDSVVAFTERNYLGFHLEVTPATRAAYRQRTEASRRAASGAVGAECFPVVRGWVDAWQDGHLFLQEPLALDTAETRRRMATVPRRPVPDLAAMSHTGAHEGGGLEGIWYDRGLKVAILPVRGGAAWEAIVVVSDTSTWEPGMVRAEITPRAGGGYEVLMRERNHAVRRFAGTLHRDVLLRMPPHMWGREVPGSGYEAGGLDPLDPRAPTIRSIGTGVVIAMPSHDPRFAGALRTLVDDWRERIVAAAPLVIDLRGNEGGSAATSHRLLAFANADSLADSPFPAWRPTVIASAEHLAWARSFVRDGQAPTPVIGRLIDRMAASPGRIVRYIDDADLPPDAPWPAAVGGPAAIAVLIDGGVVSAGESFVAQLLRSPKVTTWGEATGGVLDYQMTRLLGIGLAPYRMILGYPTIGNHPELPSGGIRRKGFVPMRPMPAGGDALLKAALGGGA